MQEFAFVANEQTRGKCMKKLLLLPWVAIGLALVPINKLTLRFQSGSDQSESDSVTPHTDTATTDIRDPMVITRAAITATMGVIHITEHITTLGGRTTTAVIDITSITSVITTATKSRRLM